MRMHPSDQSSVEAAAARRRPAFYGGQVLVLLESPMKRIRPVLRRRLTAEEEAVRAQYRLLRAMRRELLAIIGDAAGYRAFHLQQVLAAIDSEITRYRAQAQAAAGADTRALFTLGHEIVDVAVGTAPAGALAGVSSELLQRAVDLTTGEVGAIWTELGNGLKSTIRRTALGITDHVQAMAEVSRLLRRKRGPFTNAQFGAERIVRTETSRIFSGATYDRMRSAEASLGEAMRKGWLNAGDNRVRDAHVQAGIDYSRDRAIPVDQPFIVDDEELMFPLDPRGSASNTIMCRCVLLPVVGEIAAKAA